MRDYFCGWYFKCQNDFQTLAVIPAFHITNREKSCSIQIITDTNSWNLSFPYNEFRKSGSVIEIGENRFGKQGIELNIQAPEIQATGSLKFGSLTPIKYDIMGPFRFVPFMECRHSVFSMRHSVDGEILINGDAYVFQNGKVYIEGDRGRSFPKEYAWTQCVFADGALMLSVADIPFCGMRFTGVIGVILLGNKEHRIATYLGAKVVKIRDGEIIVRQGNTRLTVRQMEKTGHALCAPDSGAMSRTIHENASCRVYYRFEKNGQMIFELEAPNAAFEYEYPW